MHYIVHTRFASVLVRNHNIGEIILSASLNQIFDHRTAAINTLRVREDEPQLFGELKRHAWDQNQNEQSKMSTRRV